MSSLNLHVTKFELAISLKSNDFVDPMLMDTHRTGFDRDS